MKASLLDLMRPVKAIDAADDPGQARRTMRASGLAALPVTRSGRVVGLLSERDLLESTESPWTAGGDLPFAVSGALALDSALDRLREHDLPILAVTDPAGRLCGVVSRADLLGAAHGDLRPASVGGLATPLGVYLTTGHLRGGAGDLGLVLTGATLMALNLLVATAIDLASVRWPVLSGDLGFGVFVLVFFGLLRALPLSQIHASEHQVVHAIEKGEPLSLDRVRAQPREHPRCGTNLAAIGLAAQVMLPKIVAAPELAAMGALAVFFSWRQVGWALQRSFTTRRAKDRHIQNAMRAADRLLDRYNLRPAYRAPRWRRVWNAGILQIAAGGLVVYWAFEALAASRLP